MSISAVLIRNGAVWSGFDTDLLINMAEYGRFVIGLGRL